MRCLVSLLVLGPVAAMAADRISRVRVLGAPATIELESRPGEPLDPLKLEHDVKTLWRSGHIADVRAETQPDGDGVELIFRVRPRRYFEVRKVQMAPSTAGINSGVAPGAEIDLQEAQQAAARIRKQLESSGLAQATVNSRLLPVGGGKADLKIHVDKGEAVDIEAVTFSGNAGVSPSDLRHALRATGPKTILPGWHWRRGYSPEAVASDEAGLRSFYFRRGYFDADVRTDSVRVDHGKAWVDYAVDSGPRSDFSAGASCSQFFQERRDVERGGVIDFHARIEVREDGGILPARDLGPRYRIHRIEFRGNRTFRDSTLRRAFLLAEGDLLDETLLRKSLARLNRSGFFEPLTPASVVVNTPPGTEWADVTVRLKEKKVHSWLLSGPVGPMSLAGPLQFSIGTRLPPWGQGVFELATYTLSANLMFFAKPLVQLIPFLPNKRFLLLATIQRPKLPGQPILSGITIAPQLGWRGMLMGYGVSKVRILIRDSSQTERAFQSPLPVTVVNNGREKGTMNCEVPKTKLDWSRQIGGTIANLAFSFVPF